MGCTNSKLKKEFKQFLLHDIFELKKDTGIRFLEEYPELIEHSFSLAFSGKYPMNWRSAWIVDAFFEKYGKTDEEYITNIIKKLPDIKESGVQRCLLRMLTRSKDFREEDLGILADYCFETLYNSNSAIAVKVYCMSILYGIYQQFPDIKYELLSALESQLKFESAGIRNRAKKIMQKIMEEEKLNGF